MEIVKIFEQLFKREKSQPFENTRGPNQDI